MPDTQTAVRSAVTWFEIPIADFDRARRFYETILETTLPEAQFGGARIAMFPSEGGGVGGCIDAGSTFRSARSIATSTSSRCAASRSKASPAAATVCRSRSRSRR